MPEALPYLSKSLAQRLAQVGFNLDERPFRAHMTLARKVRQLSQLPKLEQPISFTVTEFSLVRSWTSEAGSTYTKLSVWPLRKSGAAIQGVHSRGAMR